MMKNPKFHIPDSSMHEDDHIFSVLGYERPRQTSYAEAWRKIKRRAGREPAFARRVRAAIRKFIPKTRRIQVPKIKTNRGRK